MINCPQYFFLYLKNEKYQLGRLIPFNMDCIEEFEHLQPKNNKIFLNCNNECWEIEKIFESIDPNLDLHCDRYPLSYEMNLDTFKEFYNSWKVYHGSKK